MVIDNKREYYMKNKIPENTKYTLQVNEEEKSLIERYRSLEDREKKLVKVMLDFYTTGKNED